MAWIQARWKAVLLALVIFGAGVVVGAVAQRTAIARRFFRPPPEHAEHRMGDRLLDRFVRELVLTDEQTEKVRAILEEGRRKMMTRRREVREELGKLSAETHDQIKALLTDEQLERFESARRFFRGRRGGRPHPGNEPPPP